MPGYADTKRGPCRHKMPNYANIKGQTMPTENADHADRKYQPYLTQNARLCQHNVPDHADTKCQTVPTQNAGHADTQNARLCRQNIQNHADTKCHIMPTQNARLCQHNVPDHADTDHADTKCQREGEGRRHEQLVRVIRPAKTEETVSHRQSINVKEVGTPPVRNNLCTPLMDDFRK